MGETTNRVPIPQGYATPTELTHILRTRNIINIKAQYIYNYISSPGSNFPYMLHEDGRKIVPIDDGIKWIVNYLQAKAEKESKKAIELARQAEAAAKSANLVTATIAIEADEDEWGAFK